MSEKTFRFSLIVVASLFIIAFCALVIPALAADWNVIGAFAAGFVNPFASGYAIDVILCWVILAIWIVYEWKHLQIRYGWVCLLLGVIPGVAVGFALYLLLRSYQLQAERA